MNNLRSTILILLLGLATPLFAQKNVPKSLFDSIPLELNDGHRWKVDEEIKKYVWKSADIITEYSSKTKLNSKKLAKKLLVLQDKIIDNCNMEGEVHALFHHWLVPYMSALSGLKSSKQVSHKNAFMKEVKRAMKEFETYFE